jgi:hypothetical protein
MIPAHEEAIRLAGALGLGEAHLDCLTKCIEAARMDGVQYAEERLRPILKMSLELSKEAEKSAARARFMGKSGLAIAVTSLLFALSRFL